jgi:Protein of unknown function (DUF4089)
MSRIPTRAEIEAYVDATAKLIDLPIAPEHRPGVVQFTAGLFEAAALVSELPLPDEVEAAPVFYPGELRR